MVGYLVWGHCACANGRQWSFAQSCPQCHSPLRWLGRSRACTARNGPTVSLPAHTYDTDKVVRPVLEWLHGTETVSHFHLGTEHGDLTQAHWWDWERADAVVTGPPCPPVSWIGKGLRGEDPRQKVWDTCVDIIIDQGWKGAFFLR